jgi:hypothetical protein
VAEKLQGFRGAHTGIDGSVTVLEGLVRGEFHQESSSSEGSQDMDYLLKS